MVVVRLKEVEDGSEIKKKCGAAKRVWLVCQLPSKREALWRNRRRMTRDHIAVARKATDGA